MNDARSTSCTLRRGEPRDAAMLAELGARTFSDTFLAANRPEDIAAFLAATYGTAQQSAELADARNVFLVAEIDGVAVGFAKLHRGTAPSCVEGESPIQIDRLYVTREQLGRGVGEALMGRCIEEARSARHRTMWLGVWERNARAQSFYRRWGFRIVGEHVFVLGSDPQNDLLMAREL
jgi:ribosomal protein S18 acetylase RimI-like enzyme